MISFPPVEDQLAIIRRGVEKIVPEEQLAEKLKKSRDTGTPLRIKYGIDPTGIDVHLGHTVPLRKMRQFQQLGHQAVIIIGNYTALVGDPSGRDETRARLTAEQVELNAVDYLNQVGKVLDLSQAEVIRNGEWFSKMAFAEILELCGRVTVAQLLTRDDFAKRYKAEQPIYLHECLYPVMQAWDSVEIRADIELGGTEQLYSFMLARDLQRQQKLPEQIGIMSPILVGLDGKKRMGKSLGNYIGISESPLEMVTKIMRIPDEKEQDDGTILPVMRMYYELLSDAPLDEIDRLLAGDRKNAKLNLAKIIVQDCHGEVASAEAVRQWNNNVVEKGIPKDIPEQVIELCEIQLHPGGDAALAGIATFAKRDSQGNPLVRACDLYFYAKLCESKSEARRLIKQSGAYLGEERRRIDDPEEEISIQPGMLLWRGSKKVVRLSLQG